MSRPKEELRREAKETRKLFCQSPEREEEQRQILEQARRLWGPYDKVMTYLSFGTEVRTGELIEAALAEGKEVYVPRIEDGRVMRFYRYVPGMTLIRHAHGMQEPSGEGQEMPADERTILFVPGLVFDTNGYRLGYGGGYYDTYLAAYPEAFAVGLGYSVQLTDSLDAREAHDTRVDAVISGGRTILIREG